MAASSSLIITRRSAHSTIKFGFCKDGFAPCIFVIVYLWEKVLSISKYPDIMYDMGKKNRKKINLGQVIIPASHPNPPEPHEVEAAYILARHYQETVEFLILASPR